MARTARKISISGYYHVIVRGVGKMILFEEREDCLTFLSRLKQAGADTDVRICAFCLMSNHVHLLIYDPNRRLSVFMRKMETAYSVYFNNKYSRSGHLFANRFLSFPIENEGRFLVAFRYIMQNPVKAGLANAADYAWSSYNCYFKNNSFVDCGLLQKLLPTPESYREFIDHGADFSEHEYETDKKDDSFALNLLRKHLNVTSGTEIASWPKDKRNKAIRELKCLGLSVRQLERLTGINRGSIHRAIQKKA